MKYEKILRQLRSSPKLWSPEHEEQVSRLICKCKARLTPEWEKRVMHHKAIANERFLFRTN